jgi:hypothetical protein
VIGNLKGELSVFKGISVSGKPYLTCNGLGTVGICYHKLEQDEFHMLNIIFYFVHAT